MTNCNVVDGHLTAEAEYELSPEQQERIKGLIAEYLSRLKVDMPGENKCPSDCQYYKGHLFRMFTPAKTWSAAKADCETRGGHLATSTSEEKNEFLTTLTKGTSVWIGGTDEGTEGNWRWVTGEKWSYTNWHPAQPDNAGSREHYLQFNRWDKTSQWNDLPNHYLLPYVCECEYAPRVALDPQDISHEKLGELLGGNDDGHYHLTEDEMTKLGKLSEALITDD